MKFLLKYLKIELNNKSENNFVGPSK